jgi:hypothetical protein
MQNVARADEIGIEQDAPTLFTGETVEVRCSWIIHLGVWQQKQ